jgi:hypothetical protein
MMMHTTAVRRCLSSAPVRAYVGPRSGEDRHLQQCRVPPNAMDENIAILCTSSMLRGNNGLLEDRIHTFAEDHVGMLLHMVCHS